MTRMRFCFARSLLQIIFAAIFLLPLLISGSPICSRNRQCDDGNPDTYDFCWTERSECVNVAKSMDSAQDFVPTTLASIINRTNGNPLLVAEKRLIVSSAAKVMEEINPHLFIQLNLLNVDIVSDLTSYSASLQSPDLQNQTNLEFHESMKQIFQTMNDRHTRYGPPPSLRDSYAVLGFRVEEFFVEGDVDEMVKPRTRYVIADIVPGLAPRNSRFGVGSEILKWDGEDIAAVVQKLGENSYGSNTAAQMSLGVNLLSFRAFSSAPLLESMFVEIEYRSIIGTISTTKAHWFFIAENPIPNTARSSVHFETQEIFSSFAAVRHSSNKTVTAIAVKPEFKRLFSPQILQTEAGPIGRIILPSFGSSPTSELVAELTRILRQMPENGLILDARNNRGGSGFYAGVLSTLISGIEIDPLPRTIRATELMLKLATIASNSSDAGVRTVVRRIIPALETAVRVGEQFTGPLSNFSLNPSVDNIPKVQRVYFGPVVSVVNGITYSAGDWFAAVQVDRNISTLVGTSDNVGAGGASTIPYSAILEISNAERLPGGVDFSTAFARFFRSGTNSGAIIENFGVKPDIRYYPTLNDAVDEDCDLVKFLVKLLVPKSSP